MANRKSSFSAILIAGLSIAAFTPSVLAQAYAITDLNASAGTVESSNPVLGPSGQIVYYTQTGVILESGGTQTNLGAQFDQGTGVNSSGQVSGLVGYYEPGYYSGGTVTDLTPDLPPGPTNMAYGINDSGQVVGEEFASDAFLYSNGVVNNIQPSGTTGGARAINNAGQVVGVANSSMFLYSSGTATILNPVSTLSPTFTIPQSINNSGQVVGRAGLADSAEHAFVYSVSINTLSDLGTLGGADSAARGNNDSGQIVGWSALANGDPDLSIDQHAFLYENGTMTDLNLLIPSNSGWTLESASSINDLGEIVGVGINPSGQEDDFLLTPVPEPASVSLILLGGAGLLIRRRRVGH
jgi:probable HAF family extracellular repeat protein